MEELQDAIEDAQYMTAMHDDTPKPTREWSFPTPEQLIEFEQNLAKTSDDLSLQSICCGSLGLFLFCRHCKDCGSGEWANFLFDVAAFRVSYGLVRDDTALGIWTWYLSPQPLDQEQRAPVEHQVASAPGLKRVVSSATAVESYQQYLNFESPANILCLTGQPLEDIAMVMQTRGSAAILDPLPSGLFDVAEEIVFQHLRERHFESFKADASYQKYLRFMHVQRSPVTEDDFTLFRVLGRGGFGLVNGCKKCTTGKLYAMKMMNKKRVKMRKSEELCLNERRILAMVESPFVVCLKYAFTTPTDLFLILDLMVGGDLGFHLYNKGRFTSAEAKYFASRTLLGIGHLHEAGIVYRDLKPENILMDENGRTKISDLGLACRLTPNLTGTCGTRGYWAPDMLRRDSKNRRIPYNQTVDWFSFGCVVYEFLYGVSPFRTERAKTWAGYDRKEKDKAIDRATLEMEPEFDENFDDLARDLCTRLLDKNPATRLGANGAQEIREHPWFGEVDWDEMKSDRTAPPFKPKKDINAASQAEIGGFADDKNSRKVELTEQDHEIYRDFDWTSPSAFQEEVVEFLRFEEIHGPIIPIIQKNPCCCIM